MEKNLISNQPNKMDSEKTTSDKEIHLRLSLFKFVNFELKCASSEDACTILHRIRWFPVTAILSVILIVILAIILKENLMGMISFFGIGKPP